MSIARDRFIKGNALPREPLTIQLPDGPLALEIRGLSVEARGQIYSECVRDIPPSAGALHEDDDEDVPDDEESEREIDPAKLTPVLVVACTFDAETGEQLFTEPGDVAIVAKLNATGMDQIQKVALRLSGMEKKAIKAAEKN